MLDSWRQSGNETSGLQGSGRKIVEGKGRREAGLKTFQTGTFSTRSVLVGR